MSPAKCAVIFDWNGTLFDDTALCCEATNHVVQQLGGSPVSLPTFQQEYTLPLKSFYVRLGCDPKRVEEETETVFTAWGHYYETRVDTIPLREGGLPLLQTINQHGYISAILSNHNTPSISAQVGRLGITSFFKDVLANDPDEYRSLMHKADKGARLQTFIDTHSIETGVVVGDSPEEIEIAHHYGFLGVGIANGFCSEARIRAANPDYMIEQLTQLPNIITHAFGPKVCA